MSSRLARRYGGRHVVARALLDPEARYTTPETSYQTPETAWRYDSHLAKAHHEANEAREMLVAAQEALRAASLCLSWLRANPPLYEHTNP